MSINKIKEKDLYYIAGFFDADGSAIAQLKFNKTYAQNRPYQIQLTVQFTQKLSRRFILDDFEKIIGAGKVRVRGDMADFQNILNLKSQIVTSSSAILQPSTET